MAQGIGWVRRAAIGTLVIAFAAAGALAAGPAHAAGTEHVIAFAAELTIGGDGSVAVTERIDYDFGTNARHGIFRFVPDRFRCERDAVGPSCPSGYDRRTPIEAVRVTADDAAVPVDRRREGNATVLRIGDSKRTITGPHRYVISYRITGALNPVEGGGTVLGWNVTGNGWTVFIEAVTATVTGPTGAVEATCVAGPVGANRPCERTSPFGTSGLDPGEGMTLTVRLPRGVAAGSEPVLERRQTVGRAFSLNGGSVALTGLAALLGATTVWCIGRLGRDRRFVGGDVEVAMGRAGQPDEARPLHGGLPAVMEFAPPNGIRPGQLGALVDERAGGRDVTASIVDLAIRGYLRLEQLEGDDWRITRGAKEPDATMQGYERLLLRELLGTSGDSVRLSELRQTWSASFKHVRQALYADLVASGWYRSRPDRSRARTYAVAAVLAATGVATCVALAENTALALGGVPFVLAGVALAIIGRRAGARTATGTAMAARSTGFKRLIETPTQQEMAAFADRHEVFVEYLPFAIVFGCASAWATRFAALGALPPATAGWYEPFPGGIGGGHDSWDQIASSVSGFAGSAATALAAPAASGGSGSSGGGGFSSGGGFGGGGGGSW